MLIVTSSYEVQSNDLQELLTATYSESVFEIRYTLSLAAKLVRSFMYVFVPCFYAVYLYSRDPITLDREFFGVTLLIALMLFVVSLQIVTRIDAKQRAVLQGYTLFGKVPLGLGKKAVRDGDTVRIRVTTRKGFEPHDPFHECYVRREGFKLWIPLADYSSKSVEAVPFLESLGLAISTLLRIEYEGYVDV